MLCPEAPLVFLYTITSRLGLASYGQDHHETAHTLRDACQLRTCAGAQVSLVSLALFSSSRRSHRTSGNWQPTRKDLPKSTSQKASTPKYKQPSTGRVRTRGYNKKDDAAEMRVDHSIRRKIALRLHHQPPRAAFAATNWSLF